MALKIGPTTSTAIKICGITKISQAKTIATLGVDAIGVIGVEQSPRFVSEVQRRRLFFELTSCDADLTRVWVVADFNDQSFNSALRGDGVPSVVQLHGNESKERCLYLRKQYPNTEWWKALRIRTKEDLLLANSFQGHVDKLLLDAWAPHSLGGTGNRLPIEWVKDLSLNLPWWIAGGVDAESIPEILGKIKPFGVDASSRLETSPGIKNLKKVKALIKAVRSKSNS